MRPSAAILGYIARARTNTSAHLDQMALSWLDLAMTRVKIAELKDHLSRHLRAVERGASIEVTDRSRPIARIVPLGEGKVPAAIRPPRRPFGAADRRLGRPARWPRGSLDLLLEERQQR